MVWMGQAAEMAPSSPRTREAAMRAKELSAEFGIAGVLDFLEVSGDAGRAEHVAPELDLEAGLGRAAADHAIMR
jgi:hypothetical protein